MALLTVTPLVYVHGVDGNVWKQVWAFTRPADAVWGGALGACVGAWLGAVPIPLDWYVFPLLNWFSCLLTCLGVLQGSSVAGLSYYHSDGSVHWFCSWSVGREESFAVWEEDTV